MCRCIKITVFRPQVCYSDAMKKNTHLLTTKDCATMLSLLVNKNISHRHVYYLIDMSHILGIYIGGQYRIPVSEVQNYYEQRKTFLRIRIAGDGRSPARHPFRQRPVSLPSSKPPNHIPPHILRAVKRIQGDRRDWV